MDQPADANEDGTPAEGPNWLIWALGYDPALDDIGRLHPPVPPPSPTAGRERSLPMQQPDPVRFEAQISSAEAFCAETRQNIEQVRAKMQMDDEGGKQARYRADLDRLQRCLDIYDRELQHPPAFGNVFASSGFKVDDEPVAGGHYGCTLDWGLVEVLPNRVGHNEVRESTFCPVADGTVVDEVLIP